MGVLEAEHRQRFGYQFGAMRKARNPATLAGFSCPMCAMGPALLILLAPLARTNPELGQSDSTGELVGDLFGSSVAAAGDVDADGIPDVLIALGAWGRGPADAPAAIVVSGRTGEVLRSVGRGWTIGRFGNRAVCGLRDVDGDGHSDFAVVAWARDAAVPGYIVSAFSGASGTELWSSSLGGEQDCFGPSIAALGDLDGDSASDIGVSWTRPCTRSYGLVQTLSGRCGQLIAETIDDRSTWSWSGAAAALGDLDLDGIPDVIVPVKTAADDYLKSPKDHVDVLSGRDLHRLRRIDVDAVSSPVCGPLGDVDGDGTPDLFLAGSVSARFGSRMAIQVVSGKSGEVLARFDGDVNEDCMSDVCSIADVDRDGRRDCLLSEFSFEGSCSRARVLSGRDLVPVLQVSPKQVDGGWIPGRFGWAVADGGDLDGDRIPDLLIGRAAPAGDEPGSVDVYSGANGALTHHWTRECLGPRRRILGR